MDSVFIQDVLIQNNTVRVYGNSLLRVAGIHNLVLNNLTVKNNIGSILLCDGVLNKVISNCSFENVSNADDVSDAFQNQIRFENKVFETILNQSKSYQTILQNISLNVRK